ncbi:transposase [Streptomyces spectabilis]|uniref:transposase n=1 Tax=Streptomyces spectabilis TaxID=68270 RepID=UPI003F4D59ED
MGRPGLPWRRLPCLGPGSHRHHRAGRAAPRRRIPLDLGPGGCTASSSAPLPVVPRRWMVERTFAWLGRCRRLSKDYEYLRVCSENAIYLTMAMLLVRRLSRSAR